MVGYVLEDGARGVEAGLRGAEIEDTLSVSMISKLEWWTSEVVALGVANMPKAPRTLS